jgi:hypothetical protein
MRRRRVVQRHDFVEGVRALLIDKDNQPRWEPATPEAVTDHMIDTIFAPMPAGGGGMDAAFHRWGRMMTYENILVEQRGAVTLITLNRPRR